MQAWKRRYVVLRDTWTYCSECSPSSASRSWTYCSPSVVTSLDMYDSDTEPSSLGDIATITTSSSSSSSATAHSVPRYSLDLRHVADVGFHLDSRRFQFAFYVERCDAARPLIFAADSDLEMRCWVAALRMLADKVTTAGQYYCPEVASLRYPFYSPLLSSFNSVSFTLSVFQFHRFLLLVIV